MIGFKTRGRVSQVQNIFPKCKIAKNLNTSSCIVPNISNDLEAENDAGCFRCSGRNNAWAQESLSVNTVHCSIHKCRFKLLCKEEAICEHDPKTLPSTLV